MFVKWDSNHRLPIPELRIIEGSAFIARVSVCHVGAPNFHDNCLVPVGPAQDDRHHVDVEVELWKLQTAVRDHSDVTFASGFLTPSSPLVIVTFRKLISASSVFGVSFLTPTVNFICVWSLRKDGMD